MVMTVSGVAAQAGIGPQVPRQTTKAAPSGTSEAGERRDGDRLTLTPVPRFQILHPKEWLEQKAMAVTESLNLDAKVVKHTLVAAPVVGAGVKALSLGREALHIARTTGLRTFVKAAGLKGTCRTAAMALGKATLKSYAAKGVVIAAGVAAAAVVYRVKADQVSGPVAAGKTATKKQT